MKLLIVDDEPIIREGIKTLIDFEQLGIEHIYDTDNGINGLKLFEAYLPDIVLADINMPRMNGLDFAKNIKQIKPDVRIALITGYDYFDYAQSAIKIGVDDYILKPVSKKDITALLITLTESVRQQIEEKKIQEIRDKGDVSEGEGTRTDYRTRLIDYIDAHIYESDLSLQRMSEDMSLSLGYLSGLFKKEIGKSFKNYILDKRLDRAKILILSTEMKNYEISEQIGMNDPNYFSTTFKKHVGVSPTQFRDKHGITDKE